jgi:hypothetical protein
MRRFEVLAATWLQQFRGLSFMRNLIYRENHTASLPNTVLLLCTEPTEKHHMAELAEVIVVSNEYYGSTFTARKTRRTAAARLVREPRNKSDRNTVAVHIGKTQHGYLSAARAARIAPWVDAAGGSYNVELPVRGGEGYVAVPSEWLTKKIATAAATTRLTPATPVAPTTSVLGRLAARLGR